MEYYDAPTGPYRFPNLSPGKSPTRLLIEFCCGPDSHLGQSSPNSTNCTVMRCTIDDDVTTMAGRERILTRIKSWPNTDILLWASMPCTGGSPWQNYNATHPGGAERVADHIRIFKRIWKTFVVCARAVREKGGQIANELPRSCSYWKRSEVR